jgi:hypothetical protein
MNIEFNIQTFGERKICIGGIGKMSYQEGFPISIAISNFKDAGIEVSIFHIADECLKHGWSTETTYNKLVDEFADDVNKPHYDLAALRKFINATYEYQREMIFEYLGKDCVTEFVTQVVKQAALNNHSL